MDSTERQVRMLEGQIRDNSHMGHIIACLLTGGLWLPFWIIACLLRQHMNVNLRRQINKLLED